MKYTDADIEKDLDDMVGRNEKVDTRQEEVSTEQKMKEDRYRLANNINESTAFIFSLLRRLSKTHEEDRAMVIVGMLVEEYLKTNSLVSDFKEIDGEHYAIDRGLWRDVMGYN